MRKRPKDNTMLKQSANGVVYGLPNSCDAVMRFLLAHTISYSEPYSSDQSPKYLRPTFRLLQEVYRTDPTVQCWELEFASPAPFLVTLGKLYTSSRLDFAHSASFLHPLNGFFNAARKDEAATLIELLDDVLLSTLKAEDLRDALGLLIAASILQLEM